MEEDNEFCEKHCKGYRDTGGRCFADGRCGAYWEYQKLSILSEQNDNDKRRKKTRVADGETSLNTLR